MPNSERLRIGMLCPYSLTTPGGVQGQVMGLARELRRSGKKVILAVNKAEGLDPATAGADFHSLGL
ncbi:MAG: hypothetical protein EBX99_09940, partial [Acidimicrobiia bacterium]|nr:hypothetical protein [Acidimicrobiia bacterium]